MAILILNVPKWHFGAFMLVAFDFWKVHAWDLLHSNLVLDYGSCYADSCIGGHLNWTEPPTDIAFLAKLRSTI